MTTITIQSQEVQAALNQLTRRLQNLQPAFDSIGEEIKNNVVLCFRDEKSPDGINWAALSPQTIKRRRNNSDKILNDTGRLKDSFAHVATNSHVEITTDVEYAAMMNFGGTKAQFPNLWGDVPARPFMPTAELPAQWTEDIVDIIEQHLSQP
ncbi:MAG: phage virion morphogenesis protein [Methylococcaceae bacterium]